jgi:hypothetical protein
MPRLRLPSEVEERLGPDRSKHPLYLRPVKEVQEMEAYVGGSISGTPATHHVDFISEFQQRVHGMPSNEPAGTRQENPPHEVAGLKRGKLASRSEITRTASGHSMPNTGSSHRTPRAHVGS